VENAHWARISPKGDDDHDGIIITCYGAGHAVLGLVITLALDAFGGRSSYPAQIY